MLARLRATIVPPAPEYIRRQPEKDGDDGVVLSIVCAPDVSEENKAPLICSDYVDVVLEMSAFVATKVTASEEEDDMIERALSSRANEGEYLWQRAKRRFYWSIAKVDQKTSRLRPVILKNIKKFINCVATEFARQFPPIESYVFDNILLREDLECNAIMNDEARYAFERGLLDVGSKTSVDEDDASTTSETEAVGITENEEVTVAPAVVVTSRTKVKKKLKRQWVDSSTNRNDSTGKIIEASNVCVEDEPVAVEENVEASIRGSSYLPKKELAAITKAKLRLKEEEERRKNVMNEENNNQKPVNFAPGWKKDVDVSTFGGSIIVTSSKATSRLKQQPLTNINRKMTDVYMNNSKQNKTNDVHKGQLSSPPMTKGNNKKKSSPPKSAKKRRQFEEQNRISEKMKLEYTYYVSAGDTDIYVEAQVVPVKGKAL